MVCRAIRIRAIRSLIVQKAALATRAESEFSLGAASGKSTRTLVPALQSSAKHTPSR